MAAVWNPWEKVEQIPGPRRKEYLSAEPENVRVQRQDGSEEWQLPSQQEHELLLTFVRGNFRKGPAKTWLADKGIRFGYVDSGVYIHERHNKRFFGLKVEGQADSRPSSHESGKSGKGKHRQRPSRSPPPKAKANQAEPVPIFTNKTGLLGKLENNITSIGDDMRTQILKATFRKADLDGSGKISRSELSALLRKVVVTLSGPDCQELLEQADSSGDHEICYDEFVEWLQGKAPIGVSAQFRRAMSNDADLVRIGFRLWDTDGDGAITKPQLRGLLTEMCPSMTKMQVNVLVDVMDQDEDGLIDYDEFVDFLFG